MSESITVYGVDDPEAMTDDGRYHSVSGNMVFYDDHLTELQKAADKLINSLARETKLQASIDELENDIADLHRYNTFVSKEKRIVELTKSLKNIQQARSKVNFEFSEVLKDGQQSRMHGVETLVQFWNVLNKELEES